MDKERSLSLKFGEIPKRSNVFPPEERKFAKLAQIDYLEEKREETDQEGEVLVASHASPVRSTYRYGIEAKRAFRAQGRIRSDNAVRLGAVVDDCQMILVNNETRNGTR